MRVNKNGRVILTRCEICANDLTAAEQETYGHECQRCRDDLKETLRRIDEKYKFKFENGELKVTERDKPAK